MKRYNNIFLAALFGATLLLGGCREEEKIADDLYIPGLGGEEYAENELDKWLYQNYTLPYNIDVVYRWDAAQAYSSLSEVQLVPVEFDAVQPMMAALRDVWFEPYIQATGNSQDFLKEVAPKKIVLVGSEGVSGTPADHYRVTMNLEKIGGSMASASAAKTMTYDAWLDSEGRMLKAATEMGKITTEATMSKFNEPVTIKAPTEFTEMPS